MGRDDRELIIARDPGASSIFAEMGDVVAAQFFTYENMREDRDHWRGRAEVAEDELVLSIGHVKQLRAAIADALEASGAGQYRAIWAEVLQSALGDES